MNTFTIRGLALLAAFSPLVVRAVTPPVNDTFAKATVLSGSVDTLNNQTCAGATADALDPYVGTVKLTKTVWYRFDAASTTQNAHVVVSHFSGGAIVGVFSQQDPDGNAGTLAAVTNGSVNDGGTGTDTVTFAMARLNRYYICVQVPVGQFSITLMQPGQDNDFLQDAITLTGNKGSVAGSNAGCSNISDTPGITVTNAPVNGVWYNWTPTFTGTAVVDTNFSFISPGQVHDTSIAVFTGNSLASLALVAQDTSSGYSPGTPESNSRVTFFATSGTTYTIWVGDNNPTSGSFNLEYFQNSDPGEFEVVADVTQLSPNQGPVPVEIRRHYAGGLAANVTAATIDNTAKATKDYVPVNTLVSFPAGGTNFSAYGQSLSVNPVFDSQALGALNFTLQLSSPTNGSSLLNGFQAAGFYISYSNVAAPGFASSTMQVSEKAGLIQIPVQRVDATGGAVITVSAGQARDTDTAVQDVDYSFDTYTLNFSPGQSLGYIDVQIIDNGKPDGNRTFTLTVTPDIFGQTVDGSSSIQVTIVDDEPPVPAACRISGTLGNLDGMHGSMDIQVTATGALTGKLILDSGTYSFSGKLSATGFYCVTVGPAAASRTLQLQLTNSTTDTYQVSLYANDLASQGVTSSALGTTPYSTASPCPQAGLYTFADGGQGNPASYALGTISVSAAGTASIAGRLFDGTAFTCSSGVAQYVVPGYGTFGAAGSGQTLYNGHGGIAASFLLQPGAVAPIGRIQLVRPASASLPAGTLTTLPAFEGEINCPAASYTPQAAADLALQQWDVTGTGMATLDGAGYTASPVQNFNVGKANKITLTTATLGLNPPPHLTLVFNNATGTYTGTLTPPGTTKPQAISGVVIQQGNHSYAPGFFLNPVNLSSGGTVLVQ